MTEAMPQCGSVRLGQESEAGRLREGRGGISLSIRKGLPGSVPSLLKEGHTTSSIKCVR